MLYYVTLELFLGDYEKTSCSFREADSESQAMYDALSGETHNDYPSYEDWEAQPAYEWWDDYMIYRVYSCVEIPEPLATAIRENPSIYVFP